MTRGSCSNGYQDPSMGMGGRHEDSTVHRSVQEIPYMPPSSAPRLLPEMYVHEQAHVPSRSLPELYTTEVQDRLSMKIPYSSVQLGEHVRLAQESGTPVFRLREEYEDVPVPRVLSRLSRQEQFRSSNIENSKSLGKSKKSEYRSPSSSDSSSSSSDSSSEDFDSGNERRHRHRHRHRSRSPPLPKMSTFDGETKTAWEPFIFQFERIAERQGWKTLKKLDRLMDCLSGSALEYANKLDVGSDYKKLKREMKHCFSNKDAPVSVRHKLQFVKQREDESVEQFSQRMHFLALDGYPAAERKTVQQMATEAFLRGCREKEAARAAMEKNPKDIYKALKFVKASVANQRAIFGSRYGSYTQRQVTFSDQHDSDYGGSQSSYSQRQVTFSDQCDPEIRVIKPELSTRSSERRNENTGSSSRVDGIDVNSEDVKKLLALLKR